MSAQRKSVAGAPAPGGEVSGASFLATARRVHRTLLDRLDLRRIDVRSMTDTALREVVGTHVQAILETVGSGSEAERAQLFDFVMNEALGLGALEVLLADAGISEIMINGVNNVFVERQGRLARAPSLFSGPSALEGIIERIMAYTGRRLDESVPMADTRLPDGSRVNIIIPPVAVRGACITIRKFSKKVLSLAELCAAGSMSQEMRAFLELCVRERRSIVVSGGTGSGKTTLLNALSNVIPEAERIVTVEDAAELQLCHENLVTLEARPANIEGKGVVSIRDLVRNALRMRPDRIVVGECRGGEALDMLQAMNTGHNGSMTTAHANSPRDLLSRLEVMVLMSGMELPVSAIRQQMASAIDIIVQQARFPTGERRLTSISEVTGIEAGTIQLQELYRLRRRGTAGGAPGAQFENCGNVPAFFEELRAQGRVPVFRPGRAGDGEESARP